MTILNTWTGTDRALVAADTLSVMPRAFDAPFEVSKLLPLPHSNTVLTGCGTYGFLTGLFAHLLSRPAETKDFEEQWRLLVERVPHEWLDLKTRLGKAGLRPDEIPLHQSVALVGWSRAEGRMICRYVQRAEDNTGFDQCESGGMSLHPALDAWRESEPAPPDSAERMQELAAQQLAWWRSSAGPAYPTGGRLLVAELTRDSMSISSSDLETRASSVTDECRGPS